MDKEKRAAEKRRGESMNIKLILGIVFISLCMLCVFSNDVFALGGGGFRNEAALDAEANGMADCFVAQADSPSAVHFNPAGLVQLKGDHVKIGYTLQAPRNSYDDLNGNETQMQKQTFLIPNFYYTSDLGREDWAFGMSVTSPYGLGTDWAEDSFAAKQSEESDLEFCQINPSVAYKLNDTTSLGFGVDYVMSHISKHKIHTLNSGDFQLKGSDDGWGYNLGLLMKPSDTQSIGISYRSKIELIYEGTASLDNIAVAYQSPNVLYSFPSSKYSTDIESKLKLPQTLALGYAFKPDDKWTFEIDFEWTGWSCIEEDFVKYTTETNPYRLAALNDGNPASKDWNDSYAYGIGAEYQATDKLDLRGGYLFVETPVPSISFETALPDSDRHGVTLGAGYKVKDDFTIDMAYFGVYFVGRDVTNDVASASSDLDGNYDGYVNIVSVGCTYKY